METIKFETGLKVEAHLVKSYTNGKLFIYGDEAVVTNTSNEVILTKDLSDLTSLIW